MEHIEMKEKAERRQNRDVRSLIEEFMASDYICQEVDWKLHYASPYSCTGALNRGIEAAGRKSQCSAVTQNKKVFLKKTLSITLKPATLEPEPEDEVKEDTTMATPVIFREDERRDRVEFIEVDPKVISGVKPGSRRGKYKRLIEEFIDSNITVANVPYKAHVKSPATMSQTIRQQINRMGLDDIVRVIRFDGSVYLINIPMMEKLEVERDD